MKVKSKSPRGKARNPLWAVARLRRRAHDLDVLLRHRLLLEAHGFEGLICRLVDLEADDLLVPQCPDSGAASLDRRAAYPPLLADSAREDDRICAGGKNLHGIDASFTQCRVSLLHERTPRRAAGVHAAIESIRIRPVKC